MINYAAIIIDIRHSREYDEKERYYAQDKLFSVVQFINKHYENELIKKFDFSSGDSIQALFNHVSDAFSSYCFIKNLFYPFQIRCGIGFAEINQMIFKRDYKSTNMFDGIAYHLAVSALNDCKKENYEFLLYSKNEEKDNLVNQIMSTVELLNLDHTNKQADIFNIFNLLYPLEFKEKNENEEINYSVKYIIDKLKQNVLTYQFDQVTYKSIKNLLYDEVVGNYLERTEHFHKLFGNSFPARMNYVCAEILNVTRQNIEKIRIVGKFDEIRKLERLVLDYTKKEYKGGSK